jgi:hypothetical protein
MTQQQLSPLAQRMLGVIYEFTMPDKASCIAGWHICDMLDVDRGQLRCMIPGTEYDNALKELIDADLVEEVPNLGCRYRLKR